MKSASIPRRSTVALLCGLALCLAAPMARADAADTLRGFVRDVKSGRADFTQTVASPDGASVKHSSGSFEFARPNRFRFDYAKPFEQQIVADGRKVWVYDPDLNQVTARGFDAALGTTPAALLAGTSPDRDFELAPLPSKDGLEWVQATPKAKDAGLKSLRVGFRGKTLASIEIVDAFDQRSTLAFANFDAGAAFAPDRFSFTPPKGADVIEQ